jgi:hypothetical protein
VTAASPRAQAIDALLSWVVMLLLAVLAIVYAVDGQTGVALAFGAILGCRLRIRDLERRVAP